MIDTHTHLYLSEFEDGGKGAVERALTSGIDHLIFPNVDFSTISPMNTLHDFFPDSTTVCMGLHPTEVREDWEEVLQLMERELQTGHYKAIGEIGMDLYWDVSNLEWQRQTFRQQLKTAEKYDLPVIIHTRNALEETLSAINDVKPEVPLIFHSFTGSTSDVRKIREICNPYFGINGVVTYKNAPELREALSEIGIERILLETDSPYLTPVPYRGKRNESSYLIHICEKIGDSLGLSFEETEKITDENARRIFIS